jgi:hypothetical protein
MTTLSPGCLCTCRQCGTQLWVVGAKADDGIRWHLHSKRETNLTYGALAAENMLGA